MCDPVTLALVAQTAGTLFSANAQNQAGEANEAIAQMNAKTLKFQAKDAIARGEEQVGDIRREAAQIGGAQRAGFAGQGVALDSGSALEVQEDTARQAALDVERTRVNARREAWGYKVQRKGVLYQGQLDKDAGKSNAIGTILGGAGDFFATGKTLGAFGNGKVPTYGAQK